MNSELIYFLVAGESVLQHLRHISIRLVSGHGHIIKWKFKVLQLPSISKYVRRNTQAKFCVGFLQALGLF